MQTLGLLHTGLISDHLLSNQMTIHKVVIIMFIVTQEQFWMRQKKYDDAEEMFQRTQKLNSTDEYARKHLSYIERLQRA